jgi:hypothetical protein
MRSVQPARLFVAIFASLAMTAFVNARNAFAQDAADSGTSVDASWERVRPVSPAIDENAASADEVLEIPQAACTQHGVSVACDDASADGNNDDGQAINAPSPGAPPATADENSASNDAPDSDWGTVNDYQNEQVYAVPYPVYPYPYPVTIARTMRPSPVPASAYAPMSSPITQAARPPLNPGPWMTPATMSAFSRPAGSPMMPMTMSAPAWGFQH